MKLNLFNSDCLSAMKAMNDKEFDIAIVDPPYGICNYLQKNKHSMSKMDKITWNESIPTKEYFDELFRVSKNQIIWGGNYYTEYLKPTNYWIIWNKRNGDPFKTRLSQAEAAWSSFKINMVIVDIPWTSGFFRMKKEKLPIFHPCQKPVTLYKWLLNHYAKLNDKILDTHLGSGSIAIACLELGFDLTGYEINTKYYNQMLENIEIYKNQLTFFNHFV